MSTKIGINGFGRIGKLILRSVFENNKPATIMAINDPFISLDYIIYQLKYDSAHLRFDAVIEKEGNNCLIVNGNKIKVYQEFEPKNIPWGAD